MYYCVWFGPQEAGVLAQVSEAVRERDLLSHTLTDRTAELQLQISKTEVQCHVYTFHTMRNCVYKHNYSSTIKELKAES